MSLKNRTAIVTGSTSGIGLAIARGLANAGANVVLNGLGDADEIEVTRNELARVTGSKIAFFGADMSVAKEVEALVAFGEKEFGTVDILVNNAGIQHVAPVEEFPVAMWEKIIAINLTAAFLSARAAIPGMKKRGWGRILSTASAHSTTASPFKSAYVTAKHGLVGLTRTLALELATHGVTANCISPGYVWTPLVESQIPDTMKSRKLSREAVIQDVMLTAQPTKQFVTVEQVAALAVFLASDDAASITGANYAIDGGWTAQ